MADPHRRFLLLFALANAGGVVAYAPLLTLILPEKVSQIAGDGRIEWLAAATLGGALAASIGNIAFGWASDLIGTRRGWASAGLVLTITSYVLLHFATGKAAIVGAVILYQLALNMMLSPVVAWAADTVPDSHKGLLGGLLAAGPPTGAFAGVAATMPIFPAQSQQLAFVCLLIVLLTAPILLANAPPRLETAELPRQRTARLRVDFALVWVARLVLQVAGALLFAFLLFYFRSLDASVSQSRVAMISAVTLGLAFPIAIVFGRLSDRLGPRRPFLVISALAGAAGLVLMASDGDLTRAILGYGLFGCASAVFLSLHSAFSMQLLPSPRRRGRDLGVLNLTNTLPAFIAPLLALWLIPGRGFGPILMLLATLLLVAAALVAMVRADRQVIEQQ